MRSFRRLALGVVGLSVAVGSGAVLWISGAEAVASTKASPAAVQPKGVNFGLHSEVDTNFCLEDTPSSSEPTSEASMSQCAARDGQDWTFADAADGSLVIIGGNTGNCLDFTGKVTSYVSMNPCTFGTTERFAYTNVGQIKLVSAKECLEPAAATQDAPVAFVKCQKGVTAQIWMLSH
jgi:hypothetical protein